MKKGLLALIGGILLVSCAGTPFKFENARQVKAGMTEAEVTSYMGRPYMITSRGEEQIWVWSQANGFTGSSQSISFVMKDGKVVNVPTIPDSFR